MVAAVVVAEGGSEGFGGAVTAVVDDASFSFRLRSTALRKAVGSIAAAISVRCVRVVVRWREGRGKARDGGGWDKSGGCGVLMVKAGEKKRNAGQSMAKDRTMRTIHTWYTVR